MNHEVMIYTPGELYNHLVDYEADDPWSKIEDMKNRIRYFKSESDYYHEKYLMFVVKDQDKIVGVAKVKVDGAPSYSHCNFNKWISYLSVDKDYFGKGIGTALVDAIMYYASIHKLELLCSGYSLRGWMYLRPMLHRIAKQYDVVLCDDNSRPDFYHSDNYEGWSEEEYHSLWNQACNMKRAM